MSRFLSLAEQLSCMSVLTTIWDFNHVTFEQNITRTLKYAKYIFIDWNSGKIPLEYIVLNIRSQ